jgi:purine-cytosine permease-like protein
MHYTIIFYKIKNNLVNLYAAAINHTIIIKLRKINQINVSLKY